MLSEWVKLGPYHGLMGELAISGTWGHYTNSTVSSAKPGVLDKGTAF
jgi:hypothetical protein